MKETGYSFSLTSLYWWVELPPLLEWVCFSCVPGFTLKFSRIALWRKRSLLDSKSDLTTNGLSLGFFCWEMASLVDLITVWNEICKSCSIFVLFWRHQIFSMFSLRGILVCSLKMFVFFLRHMKIVISIEKLLESNATLFSVVFVFQPILLGSSGKCLCLLLKSK